jgi:hypothetical protein
MSRLADQARCDNYQEVCGDDGRFGSHPVYEPNDSDWAEFAQWYAETRAAMPLPNPCARCEREMEPNDPSVLCEKCRVKANKAA